jgi:NAD(P)-dependent dehydrogenase (short-subunit alcohol dehydrogenase family)
LSQLLSLENRVFAVTGASRGMGLRFARALRDEGAKVVILARASEALDAARAEFAGSLALACDVSSSDSVRAAFDAIGETHGRLDGLINNAGSCLIHKIEEATDAELNAQIGTNLLGPLLCIRQAIPLFKAAGGGDIVNISSESVRLPFPYLSLYAATKAGLETLSQGLRAELRPDGIRVTVLRSGQVGESSLGATWAPERAQAFYATILGGGHHASFGVPVAPETMALMLVQLLKAPREASVDLVELRSF